MELSDLRQKVVTFEQFINDALQQKYEHLWERRGEEEKRRRGEEEKRNRMAVVTNLSFHPKSAKQ